MELLPSLIYRELILYLDDKDIGSLGLTNKEIREILLLEKTRCKSCKQFNKLCLKKRLDVFGHSSRLCFSEAGLTGIGIGIVAGLGLLFTKYFNPTNPLYRPQHSQLIRTDLMNRYWNNHNNQRDLSLDDFRYGNDILEEMIIPTLCTDNTKNPPDTRIKNNYTEFPDYSWIRNNTLDDHSLDNPRYH